MSKFIRKDPTLRVEPSSLVSRVRSIGQDIIAIAAVAFFATTAMCWAKMKYVSIPTIPTVSVTNLRPLTTESCNHLKSIYEKAYVEALHPFNGKVDFDSLDKLFYTKYKECS